MEWSIQFQGLIVSLIQLGLFLLLQIEVRSHSDSSNSFRSVECSWHVSGDVQPLPLSLLPPLVSHTDSSETLRIDGCTAELVGVHIGAAAVHVTATVRFPVSSMFLSSLPSNYAISSLRQTSQEAQLLLTSDSADSSVSILTQQFALQQPIQVRAPLRLVTPSQLLMPYNATYTLRTTYDDSASLLWSIASPSALVSVSPLGVITTAESSDLSGDDVIVVISTTEKNRALRQTISVTISIRPIHALAARLPENPTSVITGPLCIDGSVQFEVVATDRLGRTFNAIPGELTAYKLHSIVDADLSLTRVASAPGTASIARYTLRAVSLTTPSHIASLLSLWSSESAQNRASISVPSSATIAPLSLHVVVAGASVCQASAPVKFCARILSAFDSFSRSTSLRQQYRQLLTADLANALHMSSDEATRRLQLIAVDASSASLEFAILPSHWNIHGSSDAMTRESHSAQWHWLAAHWRLRLSQLQSSSSLAAYELQQMLAQPQDLANALESQRLDSSSRLRSRHSRVAVDIDPNSELRTSDFDLDRLFSSCTSIAAIPRAHSDLTGAEFYASTFWTDTERPVTASTPTESFGDAQFSRRSTLSQWLITVEHFLVRHVTRLLWLAIKLGATMVALLGIALAFMWMRKTIDFEQTRSSSATVRPEFAESEALTRMYQ